jgi:hypothetical protein
VLLITAVLLVSVIIDNPTRSANFSAPQRFRNAVSRSIRERLWRGSQQIKPNLYL